MQNEAKSVFYGSDCMKWSMATLMSAMSMLKSLFTSQLGFQFGGVAQRARNRLVGIIVTCDFVRQLSKKTITEEILQAIARFPLTPVLDNALDAS